jgi:hypothetical protein
MSKRKHGPTAKPESELRNKRVVTHFTDDEYAKIVTLAGSDIPRRVAAYVRSSALQNVSPVAPSSNRDGWKMFAPALSNLNQMAHKLNQGKSMSDMDRLDIIELADLVKDVLWRLA